MKPPTYAEVSERFGFPVPRDYYRLVEIAFQIAPDDPWNAFKRIGLHDLDLTRANPEFKDPGHDYPDTPSEACVFAWAGGDGVHFAFIVDDQPAEPGELPVAEINPSSRPRIVALKFSDFLRIEIIGSLFLCEEAPGADDDLGFLIEVFTSAYGFCVPGTVLSSCDRGGYVDAEERIEMRKRVELERLEAGAVPTADGLGVLLPANTVDRKFLESLTWPSWTESHDVRPDERLLVEAEKRLARGQPGTALVIARNFRFLFWHHDWQTGKVHITRTSKIMSEAYRLLGRHHAADRVLSTTDWAVQNVL